MENRSESSLAEQLAALAGVIVIGGGVEKEAVVKGWMKLDVVAAPAERPDMMKECV